VAKKPERARSDRRRTKRTNTIKDPEDWTTGDEPMTGAQESYLHTLASEAGETVEEDLTKAEASERIDELQEKTGRGKGG
jgi:Protein of unknown function (DUF3072)